MCSLCPKIYISISMEKENKRRTERQIERKNKNTSDQQIRDWNKYSSAKTRKITHLRRVQHFLAGITLREQHEHGIRWRIPKNAKSQWKRAAQILLRSWKCGSTACWYKKPAHCLTMSESSTTRQRVQMSWNVKIQNPCPAQMSHNSDCKWTVLCTTTS